MAVKHPQNICFATGTAFETFSLIHSPSFAVLSLSFCIFFFPYRPFSLQFNHKLIRWLACSSSHNEAICFLNSLDIQFKWKCIHHLVTIDWSVCLHVLCDYRKFTWRFVVYGCVLLVKHIRIAMAYVGFRPKDQTQRWQWQMNELS